MTDFCSTHTTFPFVPCVTFSLLSRRRLPSQTTPSCDASVGTRSRATSPVEEKMVCSKFSNSRRKLVRLLRSQTHRLSKQDVQSVSLAWSVHCRAQGSARYLVVGGDLYELDTQTAVIRLHGPFVISGKDAKVKGLAAPSNLSMNQTLEGHSGRFGMLFCLSLITSLLTVLVPEYNNTHSLSLNRRGAGCDVERTFPQVDHQRPVWSHYRLDAVQRSVILEQLVGTTTLHTYVCIPLGSSVRECGV